MHRRRVKALYKKAWRRERAWARRRHRFEQLEQRQLLTATPLDATAVLDASTWSGAEEYSVFGKPADPVYSDDLTPVDINKAYRLSGTARSGNDDGSEDNEAAIQYSGFSSYDVDGLRIGAEHAYHFPQTETWLTDDLDFGETVVHLADATGWTNNDNDDNAFKRVFGWYGYTDSTGHTYPDYTYTRNLFADISGGASGPGAWDPNLTTATTITLTAPWTGPTVEAGTAVANHYYGNAFNYIGAYNEVISNEWTPYEETVSGVSTGLNNGTVDLNKFRWGTAAVQPMMLPNLVNGADNRVTWRDIEWTYDDPVSFQAGDNVDLHVNTVDLPGTETYQWTQTSGPLVTITNDDQPTASFTVPATLQDYDFTFDVTVTDGVTVLADTVSVSVAKAVDVGPLDATAVLDASTWSGLEEYSVLGKPADPVYSDDLTPVDTNKAYRLSGTARSGNEDGSEDNESAIQYFGFSSYDVDGLRIGAEHAYHFPQTETWLTADLDPGETVVHLADATGWTNSDNDDNAFKRVFGWYGYTDSTGHTYPDYTYTRNLFDDISGGASGPGAWDPNLTTATTITLTTPWAGPTVESGTAVANHYYGNAFNYIGAYNEVVSNEWTPYAGTVSGVSTGLNNGTVDLNKFRWGTVDVQPMMLPNLVNGTDNRVTWRDVEWTYDDPVAFQAGDTIDLHVNSFDVPAGLSYQWTQLSGPDVTIISPDAATASFVAPSKFVDYDVSFLVTVSDGVSSITDIVSVSVEKDADIGPLSATAVLDASTFSGAEEYSVLGKPVDPVYSDDLTPVDTSRAYQLSGTARSGNDDGSEDNESAIQYFGFSSYDVDGLRIGAEHAYHFPQTETWLTDDLDPGETVVHLADATGWTNSDNDNNAFKRVFGWYEYTDSTGHTYPDYTYTRNLFADISGGASGPGAWDPNLTTATTITLTAPWAGPTVESGTAVANHYYGNAFNYVGAYNEVIPNDWTPYDGTVSGISTGLNNGTVDLNKFRWGTVDVEPMMLPNLVNGTDNRVTWRDVEWSYEDPASFHAGDKIDLHVNNFQQAFGGSDLSYQWVQIDGPPMEITDATSSTASVTATPWIDDYTAKFELRMSDGDLTTKRTVEFSVDVGAVFAIDDVEVMEGDTGTTNATFTVYLTEPITTGTATVYYLTSLTSGTADDCLDFDGHNVANVPVTFAPGETEKTIDISIFGDTLGEFDETFFVDLVNPVGAPIGKAQGLGTIIDDDTEALDMQFDLTAPSGVGSGLKDAGFAQSLTYFPGHLPTYYSDATLNTAQLVGLNMHFPADSGVPDTLELQTRIGSEVSVPQSFDASGFSASDSVALTAVADGSELETGLYALDVLATAEFSDGTMATQKLSETVIINNLLSSEFGSRRSLSFLDRLYEHDPGGGSAAGVALIRGNNSASWFESNGDGTFQRPPAVFSTLVQNADDSYTLTDKYGNRDEFDAIGLLTSRVDRNGNTTSYAYTDADGDGTSDELASVTDPFNRTITYSYANGLLETVTDFAGRVTTFEFGGGLLLKVTYPDPDAAGGKLAPVEHFEYDAQRRLERITDPEGRVSTISYDPVTGRYSGLQRADQSQWDLDSVQAESVSMLVMADDVGAVSTDGGTQGVRNDTSFKTDDFGNVTERIDALGNKYVYDRDSDGLTIRSEQPDPDDAGPLGILETLYDYDSQGNLELLTLPDLSTRSWEYDPTFSQITRFTDELGRVTDYAVDPANGNVTSRTLRADDVRLAGDLQNLWQNNTDRFDVNNDGIVGFGDRSTVQLDLDLNGARTLPATLPAGAPVHYLDVSGDGIVDSTDVQQIDDYLRGLTSIDSVSTYIYTDGSNVPNVPKGLLHTSTDGLGRVMRYDYQTDPSSHDFGWLTKVTHAVGTAEEASMEYEYDVAGNRTAMIDELGRRTEYVYDDLNRLVQVIEADPDGVGAQTRPVTSYDYDAVSNLKRTTDANGNVTTYTYDEVDRVQTITEPIPQGTAAADAPVTEFAYDPNGNLLRVTDPLGRETDYVYDPLNRLQSVTGPDPGSSQHGRPTVVNAYDNVGNVTSVTDPNGNVTTYRYDERHRLRERNDPLPFVGSNPIVTTFDYDAASQLTQMVNPVGYQWLYQYDDFGQLTEETTPRVGNAISTAPTTHYKYDAVGNRLATVDPLNNVTTFAYDERDRLVKQTDPALGDARLVAGDVIGALDPTSTTFQIDSNDNGTWDGVGSGDQQGTLPPVGNATNVRYPLVGDWNDDGIGDLGLYYGATPGNQVGIFQLDVNGDGVMYSEPTCSSTAGCDYLLDEAFVLGNANTDRPIVGDWQVAGARGRDRIGYYRDNGAHGEFHLVFSFGGQDFTFGSSGGVPVIGDWNGDGIDDLGLWFDATDTFVLDADGDRADSAGDVTFVFSAAGTEPIAGDWNGDGIDEVGLFGAGTYYLDTNGDQVWGAGDQTLTFGTSSDLPFVIERGAFLTEGTFVAPIETEFVFDDANQLRQMIDPLDRVTTFDYDDLGRTEKVTSPDPDGAGPEVAPFTEFTYDAFGNLIDQTDALGHTMTYGYDRLHRLVTETDANGDTTLFAFDKVGNLTALTDPELNTTTWLHDDLDRVLTETNVLGKSRDYVYDAVGNMIQMTDRNGRVTDFVYDDLYRLDQEIWRDGSGNALRTFDFAYNEADQMLAALDTDGAGIRSGYNYWYSNSLLAYDRGSFNPSHTFFQYGYGTLSSDLVAAYDDVGNRTELTAVLDTSGVPEPAYQNRYGYDRLYRMTSVTQSFVPHSGNPQIPAPLALAVAPKRVDFQYDPASQLEQLTRFEDLAGTELVAQSSFVFDAASRLTDMTHSQDATVFADYDWDYDAGNRLEQFVSLADGTADYNYDDRSQLTGADYTGANLPADESYTYDANGNRELANGAAYQTDPNNRLADDGTYTYEYDDEGNLTKRTTISDGSYIDYTWDHRNRLTQIGERTSAGGTVKDVHYAYDAFDRRIAKAIVEPGQPTDNFVFVYDGEHVAMALRYDDVSQEYELANRYLHGPSVDMILADEQVTDASQEGNVLWPLTDNLGSVRDIADYDAASDVTTIANHLVYDSFGNIASETNAAIDHIFGYTGRERDQESDLHYNRARYYDPRTARFVSEDPIGFSGGDPNLHRYVGNNATGAADPSGLITIPVGGSTAGSSGNQPRSSDSSGIEDIHYSNQDWAPGGWWNPLNWGKWIYAENGQRVGNGIGAAMTLDLNSYRERQSLLTNRASHGELDDVQAFGNLAGEEMQGALVKSGQIVSGVFAAGELAADTVGIAASGIPRSGAGALAKIPAETAPSRVLDEPGALLRRSSNVGEFAGLKVPMQMRYVRQAAEEAGVGLRGVKVEIVRDSELVGSGFLGMTDEGGNVIRLLPDSFQDLETLVKTLGHERTHIMQRRIFGRGTDAAFMRQMEDAAYGIESEFWQYYLQNRSGRLELLR